MALTPVQRRSLVAKTQKAFKVGERRVCRTMRFARSTIRYRSVAEEQVSLRIRIRELANVHISWGYQRIWIKLRAKVGL